MSLLRIAELEQELIRRDNRISELEANIVQPVQPATGIYLIRAALQAVADAMYDPADGDDLLDALEGLRPTIDSALEAITQPVQPTIPKGYALVPIEPTVEMLNAAHKKGFFRQLAIPMWDAMIAARPQQKE